MGTEPSSTQDPGPVGRTLEQLLRQRPPAGWPATADAGAIRLETCTKPVGDFRFDVRPLVGAGRPTDAGLCRALAALLAGCHGIERATAVPPRVYLRVGVDFLLERLVAFVVDAGSDFGSGSEGGGQRVVVSFSNPNANKPLHLGHLRNNLIAMSLRALLEARGYDVRGVVMLSDWGIHICQAMLGYRRWGEGGTPASSGLKGDHLVGRQLIRFHSENARPAAASSAQADTTTAQDPTPLEAEAQALLRRLEAGDPELARLCETLTGWAHAGFRQTYARIGTRVDVDLSERASLPTARRLIARALDDGRCECRADGSVHVDLTADGLWDVTLLRGDGTPTVYAQQLGPKAELAERLPIDRMLVVFGRDWQPSFAANREIYRRFGYAWAEKMEAVSHGMVRLAERRMRSRYGTVVTADALLDAVATRLQEFGDAPEDVCTTLASGLVKYYLLRVGRPKDVDHDEEVLWNVALPRFAAIVKALAWTARHRRDDGEGPVEALRGLALLVNGFPDVVAEATRRREPALLVRFLDRASERVLLDRRQLLAAPGVAAAVAEVLRRGLALLNVTLPSALEALPTPFTLEAPHRRATATPGR